MSTPPTSILTLPPSVLSSPNSLLPSHNSLIATHTPTTYSIQHSPSPFTLPPLSPTLTSLHLADVHLDARISLLIASLQAATHLRELLLRRTFRSSRAVDRLTRALSESTTAPELSRVELSWAKLSASSSLAWLSLKPLQYLDLSGNEELRGCFPELLPALRSLHTLDQLVLNACALDDQCMVQLIPVVRRLALVYLSLAGNAFTAAGVEHLAFGLPQGYPLIRLDLTSSLVEVHSLRAVPILLKRAPRLAVLQMAQDVPTSAAGLLSIISATGSSVVLSLRLSQSWSTNDCMEEVKRFRTVARTNGALPLIPLLFSTSCSPSSIPSRLGALLYPDLVGCMNTDLPVIRWDWFTLRAWLRLHHFSDSLLAQLATLSPPLTGSRLLRMDWASLCRLASGANRFEKSRLAQFHRALTSSSTRFLPAPSITGATFHTTGGPVEAHVLDLTPFPLHTLQHRFFTKLTYAVLVHFTKNPVDGEVARFKDLFSPYRKLLLVCIDSTTSDEEARTLHGERVRIVRVSRPSDWLLVHTALVELIQEQALANPFPAALLRAYSELEPRSEEQPSVEDMVQVSSTITDAMKQVWPCTLNIVSSRTCNKLITKELARIGATFRSSALRRAGQVMVRPVRTLALLLPKLRALSSSLDEAREFVEHGIDPNHMALLEDCGFVQESHTLLPLIPPFSTSAAQRVRSAMCDGDVFVIGRRIVEQVRIKATMPAFLSRCTTALAAQPGWHVTTRAHSLVHVTSTAAQIALHLVAEDQDACDVIVSARSKQVARAALDILLAALDALVRDLGMMLSFHAVCPVCLRSNVEPVLCCTWELCRAPWSSGPSNRSFLQVRGKSETIVRWRVQDGSSTLVCRSLSRRTAVQTSSLALHKHTHKRRKRHKRRTAPTLPLLRKRTVPRKPTTPCPVSLEVSGLRLSRTTKTLRRSRSTHS